MCQDILAPLISEDPEHCGDLYLDIAEAYMENGTCVQCMQCLFLYLFMSVHIV